MGIKKVLSVLLVLCMMLSMLSVTAIGAGQLQTGSPITNSRESLASGTRSVRPGSYKMTFRVLGENFANYSDLTVKVLDAFGETLGIYYPSLYGEGDEGLNKWGAKVVPASFDTAPAEIVISCSYQYSTWETNEEISYTAPFSECCINEMATGESAFNEPGMQVAFCTYSIECLEDGAPAAYVDAEGNHYIQENVIRLDGSGPIEQDNGWYAVKESFEIQKINIMPGIKANLILYDGTTVEVTEGVNIMENASLTIWCQQGGSGTLNTTGDDVKDNSIYGEGEAVGAGIYVDPEASLIINGGRITAIPGGKAPEVGYSDRVGSFAAGIGGGSGEGGYKADCGKITINGGVVTAYGGNRTAAIGGGFDLTAGTVGDGGVNDTIKITGGTVRALSGYGGAGIGSGEAPADNRPSGTIEITGGHVEARGGIGGGAGIGGGYRGTNGPITITGGYVYARRFDDTTNENVAGTGIGAGDGADQTGVITITGGDVFAKGGHGAGIGGGGYAGEGHGNGGGAGGTILISGGNIIAISTIGAGIGGGGSNDVGSTGNGGIITINGGNVTAISYEKGAGIGGGNDGNSGIITINGGNVFASGGKYSEEWLNAAHELYDSAEYWSDPDPNASEAIDAGFIFGALLLGFIESGDWGGAGIGGGDARNGEKITINGGTVIAVAGQNGAHAIGMGYEGSTDGTVTVYEDSKTTYADLNDSGEIGSTTTVNGATAGAQAATSHAYAKIEPSEITVSFNVGNHGEAPEPQTVTWGSVAERPEDPTAEDRIFDNWYTDESFSTPFDFTKPIWSSVTVYGKWHRLFEVGVQIILPDDDKPESIEVSYRNQYFPESEDIGTVRLGDENGWMSSIVLSEISLLTLIEHVPDGFMVSGCVLAGVSDTPIAMTSETIDFATLNLTAEEKAALLSGRGILQLTNSRVRVYSAHAEWDIPKSNYKPATVTAALQHFNGTEWETEETVELSETNDYSADFHAIPAAVDMDQNYRVRELDQDGNVVLNSEDADGSGSPTATYRIYPWADTEMDMTYQVSYAVEGSMTTITNSAGKYYCVSIQWENIEDETDKPEKVNVYLIKDGNTNVAHLILNEANHWEGVFEGQMDDAEYSAWEENQDESGTTTWFNVTRGGQTRTYQYDIAVATDLETRSTVITNTKSGTIYSVQTIWNGPEGSPWPERIYAVFAQLQHCTMDDQGHETWADVGEQIRLAVNVANWSGKLPAIPIGRENDYRVREWIKRSELDTYHTTAIDPESDDPNDPGRLMLLLDDADNTSGIVPHFSCVYKEDYYSSAPGEMTGFRVSYSRDESGNFIIINQEDQEGEQAVTIKGVTGSFNDKIKLNYYFDIPAADEATYVTLTNENTGKTLTIPVLDAPYIADKGYKFSIPLVAKEASDIITARVFDGQDNLITIVGSSGTDYTESGVQYTLMEYLTWLEQNGQDAKEKAVGAAAKDYCAAAQIYFNYNADGLTVSSALEDVTADTLSSYIAGREGTLPEGVSIKSISAMLEADNTLRLYLSFKGVDPSAFTYRIDGETVTLRQRSDGAYYLALASGVYSNKLQKTHTYSVSDGTNTYTVTASVLTYARACAITDNKTESDLGRALYLYNQAAVAAFGE